MDYNYHTDPGHGWIEVPIEELHRLKITPSAYSYRKGETAYLEEDCDTVAQADSLVRAAPDMLEMLYTLLPIVEDAVSDECYKHRILSQLTQKMRSLIDRAEGKPMPDA